MSNKVAHLFIVVVYERFNRKNVKISTTYCFLDFSFFMSQDDAHYQNHRNAPECAPARVPRVINQWPPYRQLNTTDGTTSHQL